jgi:hypothetical protein
MHPNQRRRRPRGIRGRTAARSCSSALGGALSATATFGPRPRRRQAHAVELRTPGTEPAMAPPHRSTSHVWRDKHPTCQRSSQNAEVIRTATRLWLALVDARRIGGSELRALSRSPGPGERTVERGRSKGLLRCLRKYEGDRWPYVYDLTARIRPGYGRYLKLRPPGRYFIYRPPRDQARGHLAGIAAQNFAAMASNASSKPARCAFQAPCWCTGRRGSSAPS